MGIFDIFKRKSIPEDNDELTDQEAEIAFGIAENAGTVISLQLSTVGGYSILAGKDMKEFIRGTQAFACGVLYAALVA
jgi:hypothetical protein